MREIKISQETASRWYNGTDSELKALAIQTYPELAIKEPKINWLTKKEATTPSHYDNTNGSLYLFAEQHKLNAWEFEVIKRIVRCRKKGEFLSDIDKCIKVLELYRDEQGHNFKGQFEPLNK